LRSNISRDKEDRVRDRMAREEGGGKRHSDKMAE
jgi:hypothetical protein